MNTIAREERLNNILAFQESDLPRQVEWLSSRQKNVRLGSVLCGIATLFRTRAIHAYFVRNDIISFKQNCYLATKLALASTNEEGGANFSLGRELLYGLLSDNRDLIDALAKVETTELLQERNNPLSTCSHVYMLQLAISGKSEELEQMVMRVARNGRKGKRAEASSGADFFSLLLKGDRAGLEDLIQVKHAPIKSADPAEEHFLSFLGTLEAKLCWFKGIPVQIDSPMLPMELMEVCPLEHYDDVYDFLKPGWTPSPKGIFNKMSRWISKIN